MIQSEPGKTAYYYHKYSKEFTQQINGGLGWGKNTIQRIIDSEGKKIGPRG